MSTGDDGAFAVAPSDAFPILGLPTETQREILTHCSQADLICVALVSKHFHHLASAQLYHDFHIIFPDEDDINFDSPVDGLAGGLDTFTTSDYDYGQHLRELSMDTLSSGLKGERSYQPYLYSSSCGKFFNTLLHLTLKKTPSLESFRWNVRVELSRPVYRQLRQLKSLKTLHIRMQAGDSYYSRPPPLPISFHSPASPIYGHSHWPNTAAQHVPSPMNSPHPISNHVSQDQPHTRSRSASDNRIPKQAQEAVRLTGFKNLKSLSVLDIDDKSLVSEIADSVKQSYSTLTELQLSLSHLLASEARKYSHETDTEESTDEDYPEAGYGHSTFEPVRAFKSQQEWKRQETILGRILGVESVLQKKPQMKLDPSSAEIERQAAAKMDPREEFISSLRGLSSKLVSSINGTREFNNFQQELLDTIEQAARKYVESGEDQQVEPGNEQGTLQDATSGAQDGSESSSHDSAPEVEATDATEATRSFSASLPLRQKSSELSSAGASIEHVERAYDSVDSTAKTHQPNKVSKGPENVSSDGGDSKKNLPVKHTAGSSSDSDDHAHEGGDGWPHKQSPMQDYIRSTRGLSLETLRIHLLPVKASAICRSLNLAALKELTLLNVGNQAPIWTALAKENAIQPLPLRSIFTDNVSSAFLQLVSKLEEVHELFMLERSVSHRPTSFAPRSGVTIDQIRRLVLKKHIHRLKRLMIKDESKEAGWEVNEKTMIMICNQGVQLEELAVSMNIHAVHAFMQYFSGLTNLRAINIMHFKNNDTCLWVVRETLRFIVDNLSHHPQMKLEWIAMEDQRVDRVVRPGEAEGEDICGQNMSTSSLHGSGDPSAAGALFNSFEGVNGMNLPIFPADALKDDSDSDDEVIDSGSRLRYRTVGPMQFYDVWGIKIFEKEICSGRL